MSDTSLGLKTHNKHQLCITLTAESILALSLSHSLKHQPMRERVSGPKHNSDFRDSHEYIQKQMLGEQILTRNSGFHVLETARLVDRKNLLGLSALILLNPQFVYTWRSCKSEL